MSNYFRVIRGFSANVRFYILANAGLGFAFFGVANVIFNLFLLRLGYGLALIGQVNGVGQLSWALMALPASWIGQRFGLRLITAGGSLFIAIGYTLLLLVTGLPDAGRVTWLFATTILIWIGAALMTVNGLPLLSSVSHEQERSHALAMAGAASSFVTILGSLAAGFLPGLAARLTHTSLQQALPYQLTLVLTPVVFALTAYFYWRMVPSRMEETRKVGQQAAPVPILIFLFFGVVIFLETASEGGLRAFFNAYLDINLHVSTAQIGILFGVAGLLPILGALTMPLLVTRLGSGRAFGASTLGMAVALVLIGVLSHPLAAAAGFLLYNMFNSLAVGIRSLLSQEIVSPRWRGATSAILILGLALGWASMALLGSVVIGVIRFGGLMYLSALSGLLSSLLIFTYTRVKPARTIALLRESYEIQPPMPSPDS